MRSIYASSTEQLIAEYDRQSAAQFVRCNVGSSRHFARQRRIQGIVDELIRRSDANDSIATDWWKAGL